MHDILETISRLVGEVIGTDLVEPITAQTSLGQDLELESIELVALAEKIQAEYGERVNFAEWLSGKELDELIQMKVGDLVDYIQSCLSSTSTD
jgi:acyl carrier protein